MTYRSSRARIDRRLRWLPIAACIGLGMLGCTSLGPRVTLDDEPEREFHVSLPMNSENHAMAALEHELEASILWGRARFYQRLGRDCARRWQHQWHTNYGPTQCSRHYADRTTSHRRLARVHEALARLHRQRAKQYR
jgi:hypothetical protein